MRRSLVIVLVACLLGSLLAAPAAAQGKKKKKKKAPPVTFEAEGSIATSNPLDYMAGAGLAHNEFVAGCAEPSSQGLDGYVVELPEEVSAVAAEVALTGSDAAGMHDLDMYFYAEDCASMGEIATAEVDEFGEMPAGVKYVVISAFFGWDLDFKLKVTEKR